MECNNCYLRYHCDEQTEWICKSNDYCKYMPEQSNKTNNSCKKCENWKYERLWIDYKFCPYCGRALDT